MHAELKSSRLIHREGMKGEKRLSPFSTISMGVGPRLGPVDVVMHAKKKHVSQQLALLFLATLIVQTLLSVQYDRRPNGN